MDAETIANWVGVPLSLVYAQLTAPSADIQPASPRQDTVGLDPSQAAAAHAELGPLLVGAGPGTGKTRTLAARVLFLLNQKNVAPENILCLTFSRKAAEEMRERVAAQTGPRIARRLTICTFHAFGLDLLRRYWKEASLPPHPTLVTTAESFALLERRLPSLELDALHYLHDPTFPLPDILRLIGRLKEEMISPTEAATRADAVDSEKLREAVRLYAAYETALREHGAVDFADLVCRAVTLLEENAVVRRAEQNRWRHILVDEFQDVNRAGSRLVRALGGERGEGIWCVGDLRQAIYRFRGASPANVTRFAEEFPGGRRSDLAVNYRSLPPLVALFGTVSGDGESAWHTARVTTPPLFAGRKALLATAPDEQAQAAGIAGEMRHLHQKGIAFGDMAVLCRTNGQARALRAALAARGIPILAPLADTAILKSRDVRELLLLLSLASEPEGLAQRLRDPLPETLSRLTEPADFFAAALWGPFGFARRVSESGPVNALVALALSFKERANLLADPEENTGQAFLRHIRRLARLGDSGIRTEESETNPTDAIRVMTVHAAKGLEFPVVFLPNLSAGQFPSRTRPSLIGEKDVQMLLYGNAEIEEDEETRLFFVALSRARDYLVVSRAEKYSGRSAKPSPLLDSLTDTEHLSRIEWPATPVSAPAPPPEPSTVLIPSELPIPAYEAERYLRCPRRYYYETVRGLGSSRRATAYDAFKKAILTALKSPNPQAAFDHCWQEYGPAISDPWHAMYHREAEAMLKRVGAPRSTTKPLPHTLTLEEGTITVQPDSSPENGNIVERYSFRRMPSGDKGRTEPERFNTLLFAASPESTEVRVRYLQTGETLPVKPVTQSKKAHLAEYTRALRGIQLRVFPPEPEDAGDCADCAYLLICPDE